MLFHDGHLPNALVNNYLLTVKIPDRYGNQRLLLNTSDQRLIEIDRFFSTGRFRGEIRCVLHPCWDRNSHNICVDATQDGSRSLYVISLEKHTFS